MSVWRRAALTILAGAPALLLGLAPSLAAESSQPSRESPRTLYYRGLGLWADGQRAEGLERLLALDAAQPGGFDPVGHARALVRGHPQWLVPVLAAHADLHALELARAPIPPNADYLRLAAGQRRGLEALADRLLQRAGGRGGDAAAELAARRFVARLWCRVAASLRENAALETAARLFQRAARLDPQLAAAYLGVGAIEEKLGRYDAAAEAFGNALAIAPEHAEARLRLALCKARGGRREQAAALLEKLADGNGPPWVRVLAYEELIQLRLHQERRTEGLETLAAARQAFPEREALALLEHFLRSDRSPASTALLTTLLEPRPSASTKVTPRFVYNLWPSDLETALAEYDAEVDRRRPLLVEATRAWRQAEQGAV